MLFSKNQFLPKKTFLDKYFFAKNFYPNIFLPNFFVERVFIEIDFWGEYNYPGFIVLFNHYFDDNIQPACMCHGRLRTVHTTQFWVSHFLVSQYTDEKFFVLAIFLWFSLSRKVREFSWIHTRFHILRSFQIQLIAVLLGT